MIKISFPDGGQREYENGVTPLDIARSLSPQLAKEILAATVDGADWDISRPIDHDAALKLFKWEDPEGKHAFWHSSAHLLAEALQELYPGVKFGIGPAIENGFYYDIDPGEHTITDADFPKIEKKMLELAREKQPIVRADISKADALTTFGDRGETYKCELISELEDGHITTYTQGAFTDLCRGPHIANTGAIKAVKVMSLAGAYWRGDEKRNQLVRVYGITFPKQKMLDEYLALLEEAKKRDHRKLGKEMELFAFSQRVGAGLPLWLPKGAALRDRLEQFLRKIQKQYGYLQVITPHIGNKALYVTSGHYAKYGKDSFQPIHTPEEGEEYLLKPMNCPHHCEIYKAAPRSYRDLPLRLAEFGTVYRYEQSGELHGLTRVRGFTQDDAHLFVRPDQLLEEFERVIDIVLYIFKTLKFDNYTAQISLRDPDNKEKYIGSDENWEKAESVQDIADQLKRANERQELTCQVQSAVTSMTSLAELPEIIQDKFIFESMVFALNDDIFRAPDFGERHRNGEPFSEQVNVMYHRYFWAPQDACITPLEQLIPDLSTMLRREDPVIFCPLHFLDLVMGYCAFQTDISHDSYEKINSFMNAMNSSLGIFHSQVHTKSINMQLKSANSELEKLYVHDHMTGLLNRRGFYRQFHQQLKESSGKNMSIVIISADLDGLKHINDTFGHTEGDNAITTVGKALVSSAIQGEVCSRFGGDEFTVAGVIADSDSCYFDSFRFRFREYLHRYNSISHKPYQVESSIGFCIQPMDKNVDLDQMIKVADDRMYEDKIQRRKARK